MRYGSVAPSASDIIYVDPAKIERMATGHRPFSANRTAVVGGDWDKTIITESFAYERELRERVDYAGVARLEQYAFFRAVSQHFEHGVPWEETEFYQYKRESQEGGHYGNEEKIKRRFAEIDALYENMRAEGYKSQRELQERNPDTVPLGKTVKSPPERGEVAVAIGRSGEILHVDGRHRLAVAQTLEIDHIPVRVVARHTNWQKLRYEVAKTSNHESVLSSAEVPESHPDLQQSVG